MNYNFLIAIHLSFCANIERKIAIIFAMIREEIHLDWVKQLNIAIRYIEDHLTGTIEYDELAKMLCCSTYQFQRMFAFMNNVPLSEYIRRRKLSLAVADIQKGERVIDVALKYGYSSPTAFSRAFQCLHGITPSEARKREHY